LKDGLNYQSIDSTDIKKENLILNSIQIHKEENLDMFDDDYA
jgi:hypothetical protein